VEGWKNYQRKIRVRQLRPLKTKTTTKTKTTKKLSKMKKLIFNTNGNNVAATITRTALGIVLFAHGAQKLLGWYGGYGFDGTMAYFTETAGLPWIVGFLVIVIEFFGALSLILGFATRLWSVAILFLTIGIIQTAHSQYGFFMNWFGNQKGEGIEYFLLMLGLAASLVLSGAGKFSIDAFIFNKKHTTSYSEPSLTEQNAILS
jgi:putative oxidoreductase